MLQTKRDSGYEALADCIDRDSIGYRHSRSVMLFNLMLDFEIRFILSKAPVQLFLSFVEAAMFLTTSVRSYYSRRPPPEDRFASFLHRDLSRIFTLDSLFDQSLDSTTAAFVVVEVVLLLAGYLAISYSKRDSDKNFTRVKSFKSRVTAAVFLASFLFAQVFVINILSKPLSCFLLHKNSSRIDSWRHSKCLTYLPILVISLLLLVVYLTIVFAIESLSYDREVFTRDRWSRYEDLTAGETGLGAYSRKQRSSHRSSSTTPDWRQAHSLTV